MAKMSKMSILSIVSIALALFVGSLSAQAQMPATTTGGSSTAGGTVVSWSATSLVLETAAGDEMTFVVDSQNILPSDIVAGSRIEVTYDTLADGSYRASKISLYDGNPTPAPAVSTGSSTVPTSDSTAADGGEALPQTASYRPLVTLLGVLMLSVATGAWLLSRRTT